MALALIANHLILAMDQPKKIVLIPAMLAPWQYPAEQSPNDKAFKKMRSKLGNLPLADPITIDKKNILSIQPSLIETRYDFAFSFFPQLPKENPTKILETFFFQVPHPQENDLAVYTKNDNERHINHIGIVTKTGTIRSKWGSRPYIVEHQLFAVAWFYGKSAVFFRYKK